ncbi:class I SAM-dependent rRNA methyltransferase [Endothiovibrio diazotrophicus]
MTHTASALPPLRLKKNEERRLRGGHLWVYSNEVDTAATPLKDFVPGDPVEIQAHNGRPLGIGYVHPHALLCARLIGRDLDHPVDRSLIVHRLKIALSLRERLYPGPWYRLVYGESDGLPGLVVDRFGEVAVVQITTAGMERLREEVVAAVEKVLTPATIILRNDIGSRAAEGLPAYVETALGETPRWLELEENGCRFRAPAHAGQKTGWFYDQRENRARIARYVKGMRVLDLFSYSGGWGVQAAHFGAKRVVCVDASRPALEQLQENADLNGVADRVEALHGDVFDALKTLKADNEQFDVVICDPPAFIKRKKDLKEGLAAYQRVNQMAIQLLDRDAILVSASCSFHLKREQLLHAVASGAHHLGRQVQILEQGQQGADHPVHPHIPETEYIKAYFARVLPR